MHNKQKQKLRPTVILNILLLIAVVLVVGLVLISPEVGFFQGSLVSRPQTEVQVQVEKPGSFVVKYVKSAEEQEVSLETADVNLSVMGFVVGYEPVELSGVELVVENSNKESFEDLSVLYDGKALEDVDFEWKDDSTLLIDLSLAPLKLEVNEEDTFKEFVLQGKIVKGEPGDSILFHFADAFLTGTKTGEKITNLGVVNGKADPAPQKLILK